MTALRVQEGDVPVPEPSWLSRPFWEGVDRGELLFQRCTSCSSASHTPAFVCAACGASELVWEESSGRGSISSWTIVWQAPTADLTVPYAPIIVDMEEGWQMLSSLVWCDVDDVAIGRPVEVLFHGRHGRPKLPYFRLVGDLPSDG